jgi:hypothetical protein
MNLTNHFRAITRNSLVITTEFLAYAHFGAEIRTLARRSPHFGLFL